MNKKFKKPPKIVSWIYKKILPESDNHHLNGDFDEIYNEIYDEKGRFFAWIWYWWQIIYTIPEIMLNSLKWSWDMFKNYFKIAFRNVKRQKGYSFINIFGLSVGMTCFILLMLFVKYELSFDSFFKNSDRIYRVLLNLPTWNWRGSNDFAITTAMLAPTLMEEFPEVEYSTRINGAAGPFRYNGVNFNERGIHGDEYLFNVFSINMLSGNKNSALKEPFSIVLSEKLAGKIFGEENPVGKVITHRNKHDCTVTGVFEDMPDNTHLKFDFILSFSTLKAKGQGSVTNWGNINYCTYIMLRENVSYKDFEKKLPLIVEKYHQYDSEETKQSYFLQPLRDIHLRSHYNFERSENSDIRYIYLFGSIAVVILLIACINYMNLATARAAKRYKEVGIRKTIGALKSQLIKQFLGESVLITCFSLIISLILVGLIIPYFGSFVSRDISVKTMINWKNVLSLFGVFLAIGLFSGSYPAYFLSSFKPVNVLKSTFKSSGRSSFNLRNILVVFQFCMSIILILSAVVIQKQLMFIKYTDTGFNRENIVMISVFRDAESWKNNKVIKEELLRNPSIKGVSLCSRTPVSIGNVSGADIETENTGEMISVPKLNCSYVDYDYIDLFDIKILQGRNFSPDFTTDSEHAAIVNETLIKEVGLKNPIGKKISRHDIEDGRIIGVVKDFHFVSFKNKIEPVMFLLRPDDAYLLSVKISPVNLKQTLSFIELTFRKYSKNFIFEYDFLDDTFNNLYKAEQKLGAILITFTIITVIIAALGLFGLISYIADRRTKEIGIRKVLGASVSKIITLMVKEFFILVLISSFIALPAAIFMMSKWLEDFVYRTSINAWVLLMSVSIALVAALITVSYQSVRAARANPVDSLRNE